MAINNLVGAGSAFRLVHCQRWSQYIEPCHQT